MKQKDQMLNVIIFQPLANPLAPDRGGGKRTNVILTVLKKLASSIVIIGSYPKRKYRDIYDKMIKIKSLLLFKNKGAFLADLNPSYYIHMVTSIQKDKNNIIILNSPLGILGAFFAKMIFRQQKIFIIYDAHNVERDRIAQKSIAVFMMKFYLLQKILFTLEEFLAVKLSDKIWAVSYNDKKRFITLYKIPPEKIIIIPSGYWITQKSKIKSNKNKTNEKIIKCVFHGSYDYFPNREAVEIIRTVIGPKFKKIKNVKFIVAGTKLPKFEVENICGLGFVKDLYDLLYSCDIAVVPLKRGAGTKLKIIDYMVVGLPIVTTKKGAEGLDIVNGKHALVVDDINENFIESIKYLVENPKMRRKLGYNAKKLAENKYNWKKISEIILLSIYKQIVDNLKS